MFVSKLPEFLQEKVPVWVPDVHVSSCILCRDLFSTRFRRHHCRACGNVICDNCSRTRRQLKYLKENPPHRICDNCDIAFRLNTSGNSITDLVKFLNYWFSHNSTDIIQRKLEVISDLDSNVDKLGEVYVSTLTSLLMHCNESKQVFDVKMEALCDILNGSVYIVKERSAQEASVFNYRILGVTKDGDILLTSTFRWKTRNRLLERNTSDNIFFRRLCTVQSIEHERIITLNCFPTKETSMELSREESQQISESVENLDFTTETTLESLGCFTKQNLSKCAPWENHGINVNFVDEEEPLSLIICNFEGEQSDGYLKECLYCIRTHRLVYKWKVEQLIVELSHLTELAKEPVSWETKSHRVMLIRLWRGFHKESIDFPGNKSELWKSIGFQGKNPVTDFRGMGSLALHCLVYWVDHYQDIAIKLASLQHDREYPLCTAAIGCVALLFKFLGVVNRNVDSEMIALSPLFVLFARIYTTESSLFYEFFVHMLIYMDHLVVKLKAGYMQFPIVMNTMELTIINKLNDNSFSLKGLLHWMIKENKAIM